MQRSVAQIALAWQTTAGQCLLDMKKKTRALLGEKRGGKQMPWEKKGDRALTIVA